MNPNEIYAGERKPLDVRSIRLNESSGFTPWLADDEYIARRSAELGIEPEVKCPWPRMPAPMWRKRK